MLCSLSCADLVLIKAQNAVNPFGLTSILTKSKGKSATINRGSDYYRYPRRILMEKENTYEYKFDTVKPVPNVRGQHLSA